MKKRTITKFFGLIPILALLVSCNLTTDDTSQDLSENLAYATISINPSVALMLNEEARVTNAHALNGDGEMIMLNLQLENSSLEDAVEAIIDETLALDFIDEETVDPYVETDVTSPITALQATTSTVLQNHLNNKFEEHNLQISTRTRVYTEGEISEANANGITPLKYSLRKKAMIANNDLLVEEIEEMSEQELLNMVKNSHQNLNKIAATLGEEFIEQRELIHDQYREDILALKLQIEKAIANSQSVEALEEQLQTLRQEMVDEMQTIITQFTNQTTEARQQWQNEANNRRQGNTSTTGSGGPNTSTS